MCDVHNNSIQFLHDSIINALHKSTSDVLKVTKPYKGTQKKIIPGWNNLVLLFKTDALECHHIWQNCGCPPSGYVFDMRKFSRHNYHQQIKLAHRNKVKIKVEKVANYCREKPNSRFCKEINKYRGKRDTSHLPLCNYVIMQQFKHFIENATKFDLTFLCYLVTLNEN